MYLYTCETLVWTSLSASISSSIAFGAMWFLQQKDMAITFTCFFTSLELVFLGRSWRESFHAYFLCCPFVPQTFSVVNIAWCCMLASNLNLWVFFKFRGQIARRR